MKLIIFGLMIMLNASCHSQTAVLQTGEPFPALPARTLSGKNLSFPDTLKGKIAVVATGFSQNAQEPINTWTAFILATLPSIEYYEIPIGPSMAAFISDRIDNTMKKFVPVELHDRTATYHGKLHDTYKDQFGVTDPSTCYVFLLDTNGKIRYKAVGALTNNVKSIFEKTVKQIKNESVLL